MTDKKNKTALVLFSDDFRLRDNPALSEACKNYQNVIPIFIFDENGKIIETIVGAIEWDSEEMINKLKIL